MIGAGGDCDDKSILIASYLHLNKIKFRFIGGSRKKNSPLHHVWVQAYIDGEWVNLDATYAWNAPAQIIGKWERMEVIG